MSNAKVAAARRDLGRNIQRLRTERDLSQQGAAKRARMHWRHWQKLEYGEVNATIETLAKVAVALNVEIVMLFLPPVK